MEIKFKQKYQLFFKVKKKKIKYKNIVIYSKLFIKKKKKKKKKNIFKMILIL